VKGDDWIMGMMNSDDGPDEIVINEQSDGGVPNLSTLFNANNHPIYNKSNFAIIPHNVSTLDEVYLRNCRNFMHSVYIQNDTTPNPWDTVSAHFDRIVEILAGDFVKDSTSLAPGLGTEQSSSPADTGGSTRAIDAWEGSPGIQCGVAGEYYLVTDLEYEIDSVDGGDQILGLFAVDASAPTATDPRLLARTEVHGGGTTQTAFKLPLINPVVVKGDDWIMGMFNSDDSAVNYAAAGSQTSQNVRFTETYSVDPVFTVRSITWVAATLHFKVKIYFRKM